jgi:hypothetical protein
MAHYPIRVRQSLPLFLLIVSQASYATPIPAMCQTAEQALPIQGRVVSEDGLPIARAAVSIRALDTSAHTRTITDESGAFAVARPITNPFVIAVTALGYRPQQRTVSFDSLAIRASFEFRMERLVQTLETLQTVGTRPKPLRQSDNPGILPGEAVSSVDVAEGLSGDASGNLTDGLALVPGLTVTNLPNDQQSSLSAFGVSNDQNGATLNGANTVATVLPRDGIRIRVVTATYDPSRGGFGGFQTQMIIPSGSSLSQRMVHLTLTGPQLQWTTPLVTSLGGKSLHPIVSGTASGGIRNSGWFYNVGLQADHRSTSVRTLESAPPDLLDRLGVDADSAERLLEAIRRLGLLNTGNPTNARASSDARAFTRVDFSGDAASKVLGGESSVLYLLATADLRKSRGTELRPTATVATGTTQTRTGATLQLFSSRFVGSFLNEASIDIASTTDQSSPFSILPRASVFTGSGQGDSRPLAFLEGAGTGATDGLARHFDRELREAISWRTWDRRHEFTLTVKRLTARTASDPPLDLGTFTYQSIADFESGKPSVFSRDLTQRATVQSHLGTVISLGDLFDITPRVQSQLGFRLEEWRFGNNPAYNRVVDSLFGMRTDRFPKPIAVSPMLGFTWYYGFAQSAKSNSLDPHKVVSGGIRRYVGGLSESLFRLAGQETGLVTSSREIMCIGPSTPSPDWEAFKSSPQMLPGRCNPSDSIASVAQDAAVASVLDRGYKLPESWRANLNWNFVLSPSIRGSLNATGSLNRHQPSTIDENFAPVEGFLLPSELERRVYALPQAIDSASGAVTSFQSRHFPAFGHVNSLNSDLRSYTQQVTFSIDYSPKAGFESSEITAPFSLSYTYTDGRRQSRGFSSTTDGDPRLVSWSPIQVPRHRILLTSTLHIPDWFSVVAAGQFQSGPAYTPRVDGDVNADGLSNDRAFIFDPSATSDTGVARSMRRLLDGAPGLARHCLARQLGRIATENSCRAPWNANVNVVLTFDTYKVGFQNRGSVRLILNNVVGGIDQLLHGSKSLRGWGQPTVPETQLLRVEGFNQGTNQFRYAVNPSFGSSSPSMVIGGNPFTVSIAARVDLGEDRETHFLTNLSNSVTFDQSAEVAARRIKTRLLQPRRNDFDRILQLRDSLDLTSEQAKLISEMSVTYVASRDSIYDQFAAYLASTLRHYRSNAVRDRWHEAVSSVILAERAAGWNLKSVLSAAQLNRILRLTTLGILGYDDRAIDRLLRSPLYAPF